MHQDSTIMPAGAPLPAVFRIIAGQVRIILNGDRLITGSKT